MRARFTCRNVKALHEWTFDLSRDRQDNQEKKGGPMTGANISISKSFSQTNGGGFGPINFPEKIIFFLEILIAMVNWVNGHLDGGEFVFIKKMRNVYA